MIEGCTRGGEHVCYPIIITSRTKFIIDTSKETYSAIYSLLLMKVLSVREIGKGGDKPRETEWKIETNRKRLMWCNTEKYNTCSGDKVPSIL
jgi:hypothetical protein